MAALQALEAVVPEAEVVAVEYPGFVRDSSRALHTLGGAEGVAAALASKAVFLKLRHRPEDATSHPLYAERVECTRLLLRVARPRQQQHQQHQQHPAVAAPAAVAPPGGGTTATTATAATTATTATSHTAATTATAAAAAAASSVTATLVARVSHTFRFAGLADYAFLPYDPLLPAARARDLLPYDQRPDRCEPSRAPQPLLLVPPLLSWLDLPQEYGFRQLQTKQQPRAAGRVDLNWGDAPVISFYAEGVPPQAPASNWVAPASSPRAAAPPPPESPSAAAAAPAAPADGTGDVAAGLPAAPAALLDVRAMRLVEGEVSRLLAGRPVWGLELMRQRCAGCPAVAAALPGGLEPAAVERIVQRLCYRFKTGPWRGLFIRRGYDPRADAGARRYQALTYSLPNNWCGRWRDQR
ncbi:General transcription factor 3C polypeptide 5 [Tetrabaena socialis]|uniref:General transcription factor 3C polypeptide 5 n=1 Tax=Tetrabaena socialis TaxID=47790 RepID=A0A2J8AC41_9CHLO|nr:General transcription factor 3C polypeptide 5 [Tetrabaena socialis]|eukprot:PNH10067.1 General transcription factor 3C polypeptide 5 [Tetrabaena socialis]